jgi:DNA-binding transcriptional LysR family regulator
MQRKPAANEPLQWDDVRLFLALARAKTVGAAALTLRVDASTVSRRLSALEETMAASLFDRGRDGISATKAAEDLMPAAERVEEMMGRFAQAAGSLERDVSGLVRITCPPDVADMLMHKVLGDLLKRYPELRLSVDPGEALLDLTRREADIALRTVRPSRGDLVMTRLVTVRWVLAAAPKLARALGTLRSFGDTPWIGWGENFSQLKPVRWFERHVHDVEPVVRSNSLTVQLAAVRAGIGIALLPEPNVEQYGLVQPKLAPGLRDSGDDLPTDDLYLVTHRALRDVPRVRVVWDALVSQVSDRPKPGRADKEPSE